MIDSEHIPQTALPQIETSLVRLPWKHRRRSAVSADGAVTKQPDSPAITVILPSGNRTRGLDAFLGSLAPAAVGTPLEILLYHGIDDAAALSELSVQYPIAGMFHDRDVFAPGQPFCWSRIMNHALAHARGQWIMYASDDIVLHPGALGAALLQAAGCEFIGGMSFLHRNTGETYGGFFRHYGFDTLHGKTYINFGLIRRRALEHTAGFDETFSFYWADVDICMQLWASGFEILPCLDSLVEHINLNDRIRQDNSGDVFQADTVRFYRKWHGHKLFDDRSPLSKTRYTIQQ